jgi:hypothetical protein
LACTKRLVRRTTKFKFNRRGGERKKKKRIAVNDYTNVIRQERERERESDWHLRDVDARVVELEVLHEALGLVARVEDGELGEHAGVRALEVEAVLDQSDDLFRVPAALVVAHQLVHLVAVDDDVQARGLRGSDLRISRKDKNIPIF